MINAKNISILILSTDPQRKQKLRETLRSILFKPVIKFVNSPSNFDQELLDGNRYHLFFVDPCIGDQAIRSITELVATIKKEKRPRVILTLTSIDRNQTSSIVPLFLTGIDGFIAEPYSTTALNELIETLNSEKNDTVDKEARIKRASKMIVEELVRAIDTLAVSIATDSKDRHLRLKQCKDISGRLSLVLDNDAEKFVEMITPVLDAAPPAESPLRKLAKPGTLPPRPWEEVSELIKNRGIGIEHFIRLSKLSEEEMKSFLRGEIRINEKLANSFAMALGRSPREWMRLQQKYDTWLESRNGR